MVNLMWGILGPEIIFGERRSRTLGLGASVRAFNELAVPGIGGIWFGKQLLIAALGVAITQQARIAGKSVQNIETANALEALACYLSFTQSGWKPDRRLLGISKMRNNSKELTFNLLRKPGFYVTQPMRMATVLALPSLGLVETSGSRFNSFTCSQVGREFIDAQLSEYGQCYSTKGVFDYLLSWILAGNLDIAQKAKERLNSALSQVEPLTKGACEILRERLIQGSPQEKPEDRERRNTALLWVDYLRGETNNKITWNDKPSQISAAHWQDLHSGSLFFTTRDAAINVLDRLEAHINNNSDLQYGLDEPIPESLKEHIQTLKIYSKNFLVQNHKDESANTFCRECADSLDINVIESLVRRDERVLRLRGRRVLPGPAFSSNTTQIAESDETEQLNKSGDIEWPEGISHRINNLFLLNKDLRRELSEWLERENNSNAREELNHE